MINSKKQDEQTIKDALNVIETNKNLSLEEIQAIKNIVSAYESVTYKEYEDRHKYYRDMVDDMVNDFGFQSETLAKTMANNHPTLQQSYMRHCMDFIKAMANKECYDGRNESSVKLAKSIMDSVGENYCLPMI